jgi:acetate kinase
VYVHRVRKYLGAYLLHLDGKVDALVFSAGIGENDAHIRSSICSNLTSFGIVLDDHLNSLTSSRVQDVAARNSKVRILVAPTDEELCIAQDTIKVAGLQ